jgi:outer membrane lipoprotein-sorting protein
MIRVAGSALALTLAVGVAAAPAQTPPAPMGQTTAPAAVAPMVAPTKAPPSKPQPPLPLGTAQGQVPAPTPAQPLKGPAQPLPQAAGGILPGKLNPGQKEVLQAVSRYFVGVRTMSGEFVQFGPDGSRSEGIFYLSKPGKIRFEYARPSRLEVVADGTDVVILDRKKQTQDLYPLSKTPLKFLLADQMDLSAEPSVTKVSVDADLVTVILEQSTIFGDGKLALVFDRKTSDLLQWTVTDAQGYDTAVTIYNTTANQPVDDKLFYIDRLFNQMNKK